MASLEATRWPGGIACPRYSNASHCVLRGGTHKVFQCNACRHQASLTSETILQGIRLALTVRFLAIYLVSQARTGLPAMALKRHLGARYPTPWLVHHKLMQAMSEREDRDVLEGQGPTRRRQSRQ